MNPRWDYGKLSHHMVKPLAEASKNNKNGQIDARTLDLINIRASQINGCAFCIDMHVKEAKLHGERDLRVHHVVVWRESPLFTEKEKAAFEWTEAVTKLGDDPVSDHVYDRVRTHFSEQELSDLTFAVAMINMWNRVAISSRAVPGSADKFYGLDKAGM